MTVLKLVDHIVSEIFQEGVFFSVRIVGTCFYSYLYVVGCCWPFCETAAAAAAAAEATELRGGTSG